MRILFSEVGDPLLIDSVEGLKRVQRRLIAFAKSKDDMLEIKAETDGSSEQYDRYLKGIRVVKKTNTSKLELGSDAWLNLIISQDAFEQFIAVFDDLVFHHHWNSFPMSLIIEADDYFESSRS